LRYNIAAIAKWQQRGHIEVKLDVKDLRPPGNRTS
jgi:hypothetical protein